MSPQTTRRTAVPAAGTGAARRRGSAHWQTVVPTAVVLLVLAVLTLLPFVHAAYVQPANDRMHYVAEPARAELTRIHVALALEGSLVGDYLETGDVALAARYEQAVRVEEEATRRLAPLAEQLGDSVRARYAEMRGLQDAWHDVAQREFTAARTGRGTAVPLRVGGTYEALLLAAARLDEAIDAEVQRVRARIIAGERTQRRVVVALALLGFASAGAVASLAWRLQRYTSRLEEQRAALRRAAERRTRLVRGISHDLRNPLHAIDGHAQLLEDDVLGPLAPGQRDSVARIRRGVRTMLALIGDLLELSRAESGHLPVRPQPTRLAAVLDEAVEEHRGAARAAGHRLDLEFEPGAPDEVVTDAERVRQVLGNLLSNAVKYTPAGGRILVRATIRPRPGAARAQDAQGWVAIDVQDSGPGIPGDQLEALFDEFARLPAHAGTPGSGLGLAIARRVAGLLGGDVTAHNAPRGGACFTLWLPVRADA